MNDYQIWTRSLAVYPDAGLGTELAMCYTALGLLSEAGEYAGVLKKAIRGDDGVQSLILARGSPRALDELGDVLWYLARCADEHGITLEDLMARNTMKLEARRASGTIKGDDR